MAAPYSQVFLDLVVKPCAIFILTKLLANLSFPASWKRVWCHSIFTKKVAVKFCRALVISIPINPSLHLISQLFICLFVVGQESDGSLLLVQCVGREAKPLTPEVKKAQVIPSPGSPLMT